jgi:2-dehydro-3-deoxygluconokinase
LNLRRKLWSESEAKVVLEPLASNLELLIGGEDEYQAVFVFSDAKHVLKDANKRGCRIAVMTKADQVLRYSIDSEYGEIMPPKVKSVDPVGSGDAFTGGTIAALLSGLTPEQALTQGSICGASVASMFGDWTGIPTGKAGLINAEVLSKIGSPK